MENAEIGNTTLANLLAQAFDTNGSNSKQGFADYKGDFATSTLYDIDDVYREASSQDLYVVRVRYVHERGRRLSGQQNRPHTRRICRRAFNISQQFCYREKRELRYR